MKRIPIPVIIEKDGEKYEFTSISECARFLKITPGEVSQCKKVCRGWNIKFLRNRQKLSELRCPVYMFDLHGKFVQDFTSVHECARFLNTLAKNLIKYIRNTNGCGVGNGKYKEYLLRYSKVNDDTYDPNDYI